MSTRLHIVVSDELVAAVDAARGDVPRSAFVRRAVLAWLAGPGATTSSFVEAERWRRAVEQALASESGALGAAGVDTRGAAPAEQPPLKQGPPQTFPPEPADPIVVDPEEGRPRMVEDLADGDARVRSSRGARAVSQPGPDVSRHRASAQVQRSGPVPKKGK